jgi:hypothetical protein
VSAVLEFAAAKRWTLPGSIARWRIPAGLVILAVAWSLFVFTGSQVSYLVAIAVACSIAIALAALRSSLVVGYLFGLMALIGPEVNGQLGNGHAPLGSLRILDAATAAAAITALVVAREPWRVIFARWRRPGALMVLAVTVVGYAILRWLMEGHPVNGFLRADLRLIVLAALWWVIATRCRRGGARTILWCMVAVGLLAAAKAAAIHISGIYAIGPSDRLQATSYYVSGHLRTILVGGDTLLILVPAVLVLLASAERKMSTRIALALAGFVCLWALGLSATRTSVLVALGLAFVAAFSILLVARPHLSKPAIAGAGILAALMVGTALLGGVASRLTHADPPHVGLNFRKDEVDSFLKTSARTKYFGQGLAGRFMGKDVNGQPVLAGWAHELPVWIALKTGILGLLCACFALVVIARRTVFALRGGGDRVPVLAGAMLVLGLLTMSMTLDRVALPEGVLPFMVGVFLLSCPVALLDRLDA